MLSSSDLNAASGLAQEQIQTIFERIRLTVKDQSVLSTTDSPKDMKRRELDTDVQVFNVMINCIHQLVSSCRIQRNGLSPVNDLPQDVVSLIFANILSPSPSYYVLLNSLRSVCKAWMGVIDGSPHYWKYAPSNLNYAFLDKVLERARGPPMAVIYHTLSRKQIQQQDPGPLQRLSDRGWPVRSFTCLGKRFKGPEIKSLKEFLGTPAPNIEDLEVETLQQGDGRNLVITNLFAGQAPELKRLKLRDVAIHWDRLVLPRLEKLSLGHYQGSEKHWLTVPTLLGVLRTCPALESLTLSNTPFIDPDAAIPASEKLVLERLNEIILLSISPLIGDAYDILRRISPNACNKLLVSSYQHSPDPTHAYTLIEEIMEMMPTRNVSVHAQNTCKMEVQGGRWTVITAGPPERELTQTGYRRLLIESLPVAVRSVVRTHNMERLSYASALHILLPVVHEAFPQLHELTLTSESNFNLDVLSTPTEQGWLIPGLRTLVLSRDRLGPAQLMPVVQLARARCIQQVISNREIAPAPLKTFRTALQKVSVLRGEGKMVFEELEKVFETVQYDPAPLSSEPGDPDVVFISLDRGRCLQACDSDNLSDYQ